MHEMTLTTGETVQVEPTREGAILRRFAPSSRPAPASSNQPGNRTGGAAATIVALTHHEAATLGEALAVAAIQ